MDVSEKSGTPKSSTLIGFSIINHPFVVPLFLETPIYTNFYCRNTLFRWLLQGISGEAAFFSPFSDPTGRDPPAPGRNPFLAGRRCNREKMQPLQQGSLPSPSLKLNSSFMEIPHRNPGFLPSFDAGFSRKRFVSLQECFI